MLAAVCLVAAVGRAVGCTLIGVGKAATKDGSVLVAHTDDAGESTSDIRLVRVPAQDHPAGSLRPVYNMAGGYPRLVVEERGPGYQAVDGQELFEPLGFIPQVAHTFAYWDQDYGLMNEHQLSIGESSCGSKLTGWPKNAGGNSLLMVEELSKIAMERCDSARCAIKTMGSLAEEHGFFGDAGTPEEPDYFGASEALGIADKYGEVWIFHIMTGADHRGAIWGAQRVPDNHLAVVPNAFTIRVMNLDDQDNFMASTNIIETATKLGFYNSSDGPFDFTHTFAPVPRDSHYPLYVGRRAWRIQSLVAPSLKQDPNLGWGVGTSYPFSVPVEFVITPQVLMDIYRDHYEGTPFDMTQGIAAGPFGNPARFDGDHKGVTGDWERQISMFRTTFSFVCNPRPNTPDALGVFWFGYGSPHGSVYVPIYANQPSLPSSYSSGKQSEFSTDSAWWAFAFVNNWIQLRYDAMIVDVKDRQSALETEGFELQKKLEASVAGKDSLTPAEAQPLYDATEQFADHVVSSWWKFSTVLIGKYIDGYVTVGEKEGERTQPGYPAWWLEATNFKHDISPTPSTLLTVDSAALSLEEQGGSNVVRMFLIFTVAVFAVGMMGMNWRNKEERFQYQSI